MRNAPNNECLGQQNSMRLITNSYALISEMRLITRKYGIMDAIRIHAHESCIHDIVTVVVHESSALQYINFIYLIGHFSTTEKGGANYKREILMYHACIVLITVTNHASHYDICV